MLHFGSGTIFTVSMIIMSLSGTSSSAFLNKRFIECGQYGFTCEGSTKLRLCEGDRILGPLFNCPRNTVCNEDSIDVCENNANYIDPTLSRTLRCNRHERIADPSVPGCKGYILCIPNRNRFQGIKFKCTGNTIFNGFTRTCSAPDKYKCPINDSPLTAPNVFDSNIEKSTVPRDRDTSTHRMSSPGLRNRPIDCKSYKFTVTHESSPVRATYFCPPRPVPGESKVRCTVFSNQFCITLERDDPDQFIERVGAAYRRPRLSNALDILLR